MKNIAILIFLASTGVFLQGCNGCKQDLNHFRSSTIGFDRHVILYSATGTVIKEWDTDSTVENQGGSFRFLSNGKAVSVAGTVVMEQK